MRSRVMPGSSVTMERRVPVRRLKSVDLPTLGRPTMTSDGSATEPAGNPAAGSSSVDVIAIESTVSRLVKALGQDRAQRPGKMRRALSCPADGIDLATLE